MSYTMYTPLNVWLDQASITDVVAYIQTYLSENTIYSETEIETLIHDYLIAHPELIGGVQSVNGKTGTVVLSASDINTANNVTIESVLASLSSQISSIAASVATNTTNITNLTGRMTTAETDLTNLKSNLNGYLSFDVILNSYVEINGKITEFRLWNRTDFINCEGLEYLYIDCPSGVTSYKYNCFYSEANDNTFIEYFNIVNGGIAKIPVPATAKYFILSNQRSIMDGIKIFARLDSLIKTDEDNISLLSDKTDLFIDPSYWKSEINNTINSVNTYMWDYHSQASVIAFVTDTHIEYSANTWGKVLKELDNTLHFESVVHGGDQVSTNPSNTAYLEDMQKSVALMNGVRGKTCIVMGNHDVYNTQVSYLPPSAHRWLLTTEFMREHGHFLAQSDNHDTHWLTYYRDDDYYGIRYIYIDDCYGEGSRLNQGDIDWINSTLKSTPAGYHVAVFVHNAGIFENVYGTTVSNFQMQGRDCFYKMLYAFSTGGSVNESYSYTYNGTTYNVSLSEDYSSVHRPVVGVFAGHLHCDELFTFEGINVCITTSGMLQGNIDTGSDLVSDGRQAGTDTETAIDVICINKADKEVKLFRCGYGSDRTFSYSIA